MKTDCIATMDRLPYGEQRKVDTMEKRWDVVVIGGGLGGCMAAIAAAREGKRVLLAERYGFLGGGAVAALVNPFMHYDTPGLRINNAGLFQTLLERLEREGALHADRHIFNEQVLTVVLDDMVREAGVHCLLHSQLTDAVIHPDGSIAAVTLSGVSGQKFEVQARAFVDATGNGDLLSMAGAPFELGRDGDHACQPMTLFVRVGGVDLQALEQAAPGLDMARIKAVMDEAFRRAKACGELAIPREDVLVKETMLPGVFSFNVTRVAGKDALDTEGFSAAEQEGRRQAYAFHRFLQRYVPGFEHSALMQLGPQIGIREGRRLSGRYVLTGDDVKTLRKFDSSIARACYGVDIHSPDGEGTLRIRMQGDEYHTIPMECLYADTQPNLIVTGRLVSSDHVAYSAIRVMPICASVGEAAGILAARTCDTGAAGRVDYHDVQRTLTSHGGVY